MAKARDPRRFGCARHKIVAAVLDVETGELQTFTMTAGCEQRGGVLRRAAETGAGRV